MRILSLLIILFSVACGEKSNSSEKTTSRESDSVQTDTEAVENIRVQDERSNWQKPGFVIDRIGKLEGKTLADIGSGALGYFVFKILGQTKVEKLIAVDIDKEAVRMLNILKNALNEEKASKLDIRLASASNPRLNENEVDVILIVNTIAYLPNRAQYLRDLKSNLKKGGKIVIIDFKTKRIPEFVDAPPYDERVLLHVIEEDLYNSGFKNIFTDDTSLEFQYYISAEI